MKPPKVSNFLVINVYLKLCIIEKRLSWYTTREQSYSRSISPGKNIVKVYNPGWNRNTNYLVWLEISVSTLSLQSMSTFLCLMSFLWWVCQRERRPVSRLKTIPWSNVLQFSFCWKWPRHSWTHMSYWTLVLIFG